MDTINLDIRVENDMCNYTIWVDGEIMAAGCHRPARESAWADLIAAIATEYREVHHALHFLGNLPPLDEDPIDTLHRLGYPQTQKEEHDDR